MVIRNEKNVGKGGALRVLFREALKGSPDAIVVLDADGQHDPAFIPNLVKPILSGAADMVIGSRFVEGSKSDAPLYRRIGLKLFNRGNGAGVRDVQSGLRAYSPSAVEIINRAEANGFGVETEQVRIAENKGLRILEVPVEIHYNGVHKPSKKNPLMHGADLLKTMLRLATEERPLLLLGVPGALFFSVGMVSGILLRARVGS
jgi:glycosyltransferase involved in cell wall biosynthesis